MKIYLYLIFISLVVSVFISCEDNVDKDHPLIGKWRFESFKASVETNDNAATFLIKKNMETINSKTDHIFMYQFMMDSVFVLFDTENTDKLVGKYFESGDTIHFEDINSKYWAIKTQKKDFDVYIRDLSPAYTADSLGKLGVVNPQAVIITKAWITARFKRVN